MSWKLAIYRIQDGSGRGPFRPGFSRQWADESFGLGCKQFPTWMEEFGPDLIELRGRAGEHFGSAVRSPQKLCEWFSSTERAKLAMLGFYVVSLDIDRVLAESSNQLVFARRLPLNQGAILMPVLTPVIAR